MNMKVILAVMIAMMDFLVNSFEIFENYNYYHLLLFGFCRFDILQISCTAGTAV